MNPQFSKLVRGLAVAALALSMGPVASLAAGNPLNQPRGLAVDSKGDLWVANSGANNVIAFNPSYKQITTDTITAGISNPTGVAFDPNGNLWVTNFNSNSVTEYTNGVPQTGNTITSNIQTPVAIAVDGLNDVWVQNNDYVSIYANYYNLTGVWVRNFVPSGFSVTALAAAGPWVGLAGNQGALFYPAAEFLQSQVGPVGLGGFSGTAIAADAHNNFFWSTTSGVVVVCGQNSQTCSDFVTLPFVASGVAIDNVRGRLYFASQTGNEILVYSSAGALLHTIK